ncbi:hypothetical protein FQA39_LY10010 [Lamprigera yunnana]|nr:hypothetical protein FQA39_LY10010 [Lamprigera yunnana]
MRKNLTTFTGLFKRIKMFLLLMLPGLSYKLGLKFFPIKVNNFFTMIVKENVKNREANNIFRPDMIQLLMEARNGSNKVNNVLDDEFGDEVEQRRREELTDEDITTQALIFFFPGF